MDRNESLFPVVTKCGGCGAAESEESPLRRGRCARCYDVWIHERPVGLGAFCCACGEKRNGSLRHFELNRLWVVLCYNCAVRAEKMSPQPRTVGGLRLKLRRERRWGDRRAEAVGAVRKSRGAGERRAGERRSDELGILDVTELAEMEVELEADFSDPMEDHEPTDGPITGVHRLIEPTDL